MQINAVLSEGGLPAGKLYYGEMRTGHPTVYMLIHKLQVTEPPIIVVTLNLQNKNNNA